MNEDVVVKAVKSYFPSIEDPTIKLSTKLLDMLRTANKVDYNPLKNTITIDSKKRYRLTMELYCIYESIDVYDYMDEDELYTYRRGWTEQEYKTITKFIHRTYKEREYSEPIIYYQGKTKEYQATALFKLNKTK